MFNNFSSDFLQVTAASNMAQTQVVNTMIQQPGVANPTVYNLGNTTPNMAAPQYTAQQLATMGLQAQVFNSQCWF